MKRKTRRQWRRVSFYRVSRPRVRRTIWLTLFRKGKGQRYVQAFGPAPLIVRRTRELLGNPTFS
jgi:hypothetical protein